MFKPDIIKMTNMKDNLPPCPAIFDKEELIKNMNRDLEGERAGPVALKILDIKNPRRTWIRYEYHLDVSYNTSTNEKAYIIMPNNYFDDKSYPLGFEEQLYNRLARVQLSINKGV